MIWHTEIEKRIIRKHGGTPLKKYGFDGKIKGRPVEVRAIKKDDRFRIQKNVHRHLVTNKGKYIFVNGRDSRIIPAKKVSGLIGKGKWFKDRDYPHKFVKKKQVF